MIERAKRRRQVRSDADSGTVIDMFMGRMWYRRLVTGERIAMEDGDKLVELFLRGLQPHGTRRMRSKGGSTRSSLSDAGRPLAVRGPTWTSQLAMPPHRPMEQLPCRGRVSGQFAVVAERGGLEERDAAPRTQDGCLAAHSTGRNRREVLHLHFQRGARSAQPVEEVAHGNIEGGGRARRRAACPAG